MGRKNPHGLTATTIVLNTFPRLSSYVTLQRTPISSKQRIQYDRTVDRMWKNLPNVVYCAYRIVPTAEFGPSRVSTTRRFWSCSRASLELPVVELVDDERLGSKFPPYGQIMYIR